MRTAARTQACGSGPGSILSATPGKAPDSPPIGSDSVCVLLTGAPKNGAACQGDPPPSGPRQFDGGVLGPMHPTPHARDTPPMDRQPAPDVAATPTKNKPSSPFGGLGLPGVSG